MQTPVGIVRLRTEYTVNSKKFHEASPKELKCGTHSVNFSFSDMDYNPDDEAILRSAASMRATFGTKAEAECMRSIEKMRRFGDIEGEQIWQRIAKSVREMELPEAELP